MRRVKDVVMVQSERHDVGYVLRICAIAALGGILFGYDTSVISGAISPLQEYFHLSPAQTGWAVSNVVIGCMVGAIISGAMADRLGRRMTLFICALLFSVQSIGTALATDFTWFVIYRMLGGIAVGVASAVSPMYMSEVSPKDMRGRALSMEQFAIVFGQVVVFIVNYLIARSATPEWLLDMGWRWMFGSEIVPCILFCAMIFFIPESPRWHVLKGRHDEALKTLTRISNEHHARNLHSEIKQSLGAVAQSSLGFTKVLGDARARWIIFVGASIAALQQVTGINVMMYYAPMVLKSTSGSLQAALFQTIWIGFALLLGCIIGAWIVDRHGRKPLMLWGSIGMVLGLLVVSWGSTPSPPAHGAVGHAGFHAHVRPVLGTCLLDPDFRDFSQSFPRSGHQSRRDVSMGHELRRQSVFPDAERKQISLRAISRCILDVALRHSGPVRTVVRDEIRA